MRGPLVDLPISSPPSCMPALLFQSLLFPLNDVLGNQPRPQGFSLKKWVGREKALASAGHVSPRTP